MGTTVIHGRVWGRVFASAALLASAIAGAQGQAPPSSAALPKLNSYILPNKTASIALPADWRVLQTGVAFVRAQGPNGEIAIFGIVVPARNGTTTASGPAGITQAYTAPLQDKFTQSLSWVLAQTGKPGVPIKILSEKGFNAAAAFGKCSTYTMLLGAQGGVAAEADFCSLPADASGNYKNFFKIVGLGSGMAMAERPMLEAILSSYRLNIPAIKQQVASGGKAGQPGQGGAPAGPAMQGGAGQAPANSMQSLQQQQLAWQLAQAQINAIQGATAYAQRSSQQNFDTFDHDLRGDTAIYGNNSSQPLFWVSD